jgi:hypothetical protein
MIETEEEKENKISEISDKLGDIVIVQESTKKNISKIAGITHSSLKGRPQEKPRKNLKDVIVSAIPYGDERSIRKTIGAAILLLSGMAVFSAFLAFVIMATTSLLNEFGFTGGVIAIFIGISIPVGIVAFYIATGNKHEREKHIEEALKNEK